MDSDNFETDDVNVRDTVLRKRLNIAVSFLETPIDEETLDDLYNNILITVPSLLLDEHILTLASQEIIPPLVEATRFNHALSENLENAQDEVSPSRDATMIKNVRLVPYHSSETYVFDPTLRPESKQYTRRMSTVFSVPYFLTYYNQADHSGLGDQVTTQTRNGGLPVTSVSAVLLKQQEAIHPDSWGTQLSSRKGLLNAAFRVFTVIADHLLRSKMLPLYGSLATEKDGKFPGNTDQPNASVSSVASHFSALPVFSYVLPMYTSLVHYAHTLSPNPAQDNQLTKDIALQISRVKKFGEVDAIYLNNADEVAKRLSKLKPIGAKITVDEDTKDDLTRLSLDKRSRLISASTVKMLTLIDVISKIDIPDEHDDELRIALDEASKAMYDVSDNLLRILMQRAKRRVGAAIDEERAHEDLDAYLQDDDDPMDNIPNKWVLLHSHMTPAWQHCSESQQILQSVQTLWENMMY